ncbi:hypothetical protein D3C72_870500 [compost metagenome]
MRQIELPLHFDQSPVVTNPSLIEGLAVVVVPYESYGLGAAFNQLPSHEVGTVLILHEQQIGFKIRVKDIRSTVYKNRREP